MLTKTIGKLELTIPGDRQIVMKRVFDAPRELVFEALTTRELLLRWFTNPPDYTLEVCEFEARKGGKYRYVWRGTHGEMGMGGVITDIKAPERIEATERFDTPWYPGDASSTIVLTENGGRTTLTLTVTYASREARDMVLKTPMESGVAASYDRLDSFLAAGRKSETP